MSDETQNPEIDDNEAPIIPPDAKEQRPILPAGDYRGTLTRWRQHALTFESKDGPQTVRYDDINVQITHPELGICFVQTSPFNRRYNTSFEPKSASSAERFRKQMGVGGYSNAQLAEWIGEGRPVDVKVVNVGRPDKQNLDDDGKPGRIVEALIANILPLEGE